MRSILDHFRYGLRYGLHFCKLTGQEEVDFEPFLLRVGTSPQNDLAKRAEKGRFWIISVLPRSKRPEEKSRKVFLYIKTQIL